MTASALGPGDLYWTENAAFPVKVLHRYMVKRGLGVHRAGNARGRAEARLTSWKSGRMDTFGCQLVLTSNWSVRLLYGAGI